MSNSKLKKITAAGLLVTLGIIFGDIGTSPLYVLRSIVGDRPVSEQLVFGGISCIFWTLTLQTSIKYIFLTLQADNRGEGGIFSLYALVRRYGKQLMIPAIIGAGTLLADGIITPPISVSSAIEGLQIFKPDLHTVPIVLVILTLLFAFQRFGTRIVGGAFGPIMLVWFTMIGLFGSIYVIQYPVILKALSPHYAIDLLVNYPRGFWLLGAVFLCTTGAEALYSDLGHCGRKNIRVAWIFVKIALVLNYFGQGAWLMQSYAGKTIGDQNPFFAMIPHWFLLPAILIATAATIIASQALISGSFTLISEAVNLGFWPRVKVSFPTETRGQLYVPSINWLLWAGCMAIQLYFQESANMEAAYGFSITIAMLMTSILLTYFLRYIKKYPAWLVGLILTVFLTVEVSFLIANVSKLLKRLGILIFEWGLISSMWIWYKGTRIKNRYLDLTDVRPYLTMLGELSRDESVAKYSTHLVYLTKSNSDNFIESKVIYSILKKQPKRADIYWFLHIEFQDDPYTMEYYVEELVPGVVYKIVFNIGFRVPPKVNLFFRKALEDLAKDGEVDIMSRYESLRKYNTPGDFKFVVIEKVLSSENQLKPGDRFLLHGYFLINRMSIVDVKAFGLDTSNVVTENVPLVIAPPKTIDMRRITKKHYTFKATQAEAHERAEG